MKRLLGLLGTFLLGAVVSAVVLWFAIVRPISRASASVYCDSFEAKVNWAIELRLGDQDRLLKDFESSLPEFVMAVHYFGDAEYATSALRRAKEYYQLTGMAAPTEVSEVIARVPAQSTALNDIRRAADRAKSNVVKIGDIYPTPSFQTIDGQSIDLAGKITVLSFFATWCRPCMAELPHLEKDLWEPLKGKGLQVVAIGRGHSESELKVFRKQKEFTFPLVADPKNEIFNGLATGYIPRCLVIGRDGRIKSQEIGFVLQEFEALRNIVATELGE